MKFRKFGRATLAAVLSLGAAAALIACTGPNDTVDYVYVTNSKNTPGQVNVYDLHSESGGLAQIADSPYPSGGSNPVALVTSPNFKNLYVINNGEGGSAGSGIVQFAIGTDAKLYAQHTYRGPAGSSLSVPNGVAINTAGTLLFVTYNYILGGSTSASPSSGALVVYPINSDGSLGTPVSNGSLPYYPLSTGTDILNPTAINVLTQNPENSTTTGPTFVYVVSQNSTTGLGSISAFSVASSGALTYVPCTSSASICDSSGNGTFEAGTSPSAIASTPLGLFLYVTDSTRNELLSYAVQSNGQIIPVSGSPINTDVNPDAVTVDPHGEYVYVANYAANNISAYVIDHTSPTGGLTHVGSYGTGTGPTCVFVEPALGSYIYTTNFLDSTVSGLNIDLSSGTLAPVQNTPFVAAGQPTCIAATVHGKHPAITSAN
ncbi:MAG TPA: beta-propeller fold lactonase family protein [Silvibacterium sp.]|nr:beta-propeller fold lactonase family protein [Silvibacterium sp.]